MGSAMQHKVGQFGLVLVSTLLFISVLVTNGLAAAGHSALFLNKTGDIIDKYYLEITPAGWTFSIWIIIYIWQLALLGYSLSTLCRPGIKGYLYLSPNIIPVKFYLCYNAASILSIAWVFLWDRQIMFGSFPVLLMLSVTLYLCLAVSSHALTFHLSVLKQHNLMKETWLIRSLVHNGLAFYATWVFVASLLNFAIVLIYFAHIQHQTACSVCLGLLSIIILVYVILDTFLLDRFSRYTFSHYLVIIVALFGSNDRNYVVGQTNSTFSFFILAAACAAAILKMIMMMWRHRSKPLDKEEGTLVPTTEAESEL